MSDEPTGAAGQTAETPILIPKERLDEVIGQRQKLKEQLQTLRDELGRYTSADEERQRKDAEAKGEYEKLKADLLAQNQTLQQQLTTVQQNYQIAEMTRDRGIKASAALIRAHASEIGVDLATPDAWATVLDDFSAKYPELRRTETPAAEKSSPGAAGHPGASTAQPSGQVADPLLRILPPMPGLGPFAGR